MLTTKINRKMLDFNVNIFLHSHINSIYNSLTIKWEMNIKCKKLFYKLVVFIWQHTGTSANVINQMVLHVTKFVNI